MASFGSDIDKKLAWQNIEPFFLYRICATELCLLVGDGCVIEIFIAVSSLVVVYVVSEIFADKAVEKHSKHILFEVQSVHAAAQVVGDLPDCAVQFGSFLFFCAVSVVRHIFILVFFL